MALRPLSTQYTPPLDRACARVEVESSGCWRWIGARTLGGYARIRISNRQTYAHRLMYEALVGAIPAGLTIDHLCLNTLCINPLHMEPVTNSENVRRQALRLHKTHCKNGHPFDEKNTGHSPGYGGGRWRYCRACALARYHRRRAEAA